MEYSERVYPLRRLATISLAGGVGLAIGLSAIGAIRQWQAHRAKSWNTSALTASFLKADLTFETSQRPEMDLRLGIQFAVKNSTGSDVQIKKGTGVLTRLAKSGALTPTYGAEVHEDVFVPASQSAVVNVLTVDDCREYKDNWSACMNRDFAEAQSLVIFLQDIHYQIEMPFPHSQ